MKKEGRNFKERKNGYMGALGGRKVKGRIKQLCTYKRNNRLIPFFSHCQRSPSYRLQNKYRDPQLDNILSSVPNGMSLSNPIPSGIGEPSR